MENINFLPPSFENKNRRDKIKLYKTMVLILWLCCLALFVIYTFQENKNKTLDTEVIKSNKEGIPSIVKTASTKNTLDITTFRKFLINLETDIPYKVISIDGKRLNIELAVENQVQYYKIVNLIENKDGFKIINLSSPFDNNGTLKFKMLIEVV